MWEGIAASGLFESNMTGLALLKGVDYTENSGFSEKTRIWSMFFICPFLLGEKGRGSSDTDAVCMLHTLFGTEYVWIIKGAKKVRNRACFGNMAACCVFRLAIRRGIIKIEIPVCKSDAPESDSGGS